MRIGIVGAAGTGKSTLAADLAAALGVPLIPDTTRDALVEHYGKATWRGLKDTRIRRTIRLDALERKIKAETETESFVSDKTVVDYLGYWLQNQAEFETKEQTQTVIDTVKAHLPRIDVFVFLPYREVVDWAEDRSTDPIHNLKVAGLKRGLLTVLGARVVDAPYTFGEDVKAWIARHLGGSAAPGGGAGAASGSAPAGPAPGGESDATGAAGGRPSEDAPRRKKTAAKKK
jgi:predicted ATPase